MLYHLRYIALWPLDDRCWAYTDLNSDLAHLVTNVGCGVTVQADSPQSASQYHFEGISESGSVATDGTVGACFVWCNTYARSVVTGQYNVLIQALTTDGVCTKNKGR